MSLDVANNRRAATWVWPIPDSTIDAFDRRQAALVYPFNTGAGAVATKGWPGGYKKRRKLTRPVGPEEIIEQIVAARPKRAQRMLAPEYIEPVLEQFRTSQEAQDFLRGLEGTMQELRGGLARAMGQEQARQAAILKQQLLDDYRQRVADYARKLAEEEEEDLLLFMMTMV